MVWQLKNYGIILASGVGNRYHGDIPKQFAKIAGKTVMGIRLISSRKTSILMKLFW